MGGKEVNCIRTTGKIVYALFATVEPGSISKLGLMQPKGYLNMEYVPMARERALAK
jgi:hypothetical protein